VEGERDLDPIMLANTRLVDLSGARGFGIARGSINVDVGGTDVTVDLTNAHTVQDVIDALNAAIQPLDAAAVVDIDPATNNRLRIMGNTVDITMSDFGAAATAADLGVSKTFVSGPPWAPPANTGVDLNPKLTELTAVSSLSGVTVPMGTIRIVNAGQSRDLDLSGATTVQDIMNAVEGLNLGVRVEIAETGDRLNFINELSGGQMGLAEVAGGMTATELGVRSFTGSTELADFNRGLGVEIRTGSVDPVTGLPDPAADLDFRVTLKDGRFFDVDLAGATTVSDVLTAVNTAATTAGIGVPAEFNADLAADGNGIELTDNTLPVGGTTSVTALNGSHAAEDLGIGGSTTSAVFTGEDRATVAVESVFTHLIELRDALAGNDERGISLATDRLERDISRLAEARAGVGVRSRRVSDAVTREEDLRIQDIALRSEVQDLDYSEAAIRFASLQQQLQAGLTTASRLTDLSLLNFLR
jgi:flagellin-like hook-associated protein FlgL